MPSASVSFWTPHTTNSATGPGTLQAASCSYGVLGCPHSRAGGLGCKHADPILCEGCELPLHVKDAAARAKGKVAWNAFPAAQNTFQEQTVPPFSSAPQMRQRKYHCAAQSSLLSCKYWVLLKSTVKRWLTGRWNLFKILKCLILQLEVAAIV